ncbi:MAG: N-acetylmuramoyl-L-alanine amidase [Lachnospiraceae bacterium]|nr:N-acetylmuramoyl-L-alanine amidase [Lachnospiraceae bacterium]
MEELVKRYARIISILCFCVVIILASMPYINEKIANVISVCKERWEDVQQKKEREVYERFLKDTKKEEAKPTDVMIPGTVRIPLDSALDVAEIQFDNDFMNHTLTVFFPNMTEDILDKRPMVGSPDHIDDLEVTADESGLYVQFITDTVIEPTVTYQDNYMFLKLNKPDEIYDRIVVIDAGHGGIMPGMVVNGIKEKDVNLDIVYKIKALFDEDTSVKVYYTRLNDEDIPLEKRAGLANDLNANLFLSVHLNSYGRAYNSTNGTMTMYNELLGEENNRSKEFARIINTALVNALGSRNLGLTKGSSILIIRESEVPVALVELGFMSNKDELEKLISEEYQDIIAKTIYETIIKALDEGF